MLIKNKNKLSHIIISLLLFITINNAIAQQKEKKVNAFMFYMNAPSATILIPEKSDECEIGKTSWMTDLGMEVKLRGLITLSGGVGIGSIKDYNPFTQNTTLGEKESTFMTYSYNLKSGIWIPEFSVLKKRDLHVAMGANLGWEGFTGTRKIENCSDCRSDHFSFKNGIFAEPEMNFFFFQDYLGIGTSYRYYFNNSDLEYKIVLLKLILRINQPIQ